MASELKFKIPEITPEYLDQCAHKSYELDRACPENFSNWYPRILDFGKFKHSEIISNQIFTFEEVEILHKTDIIEKVNWDEIKLILKPTLDKLNYNDIYNIKNGCFSNKFDFATCTTTKFELPVKFWQIDYMSCLFETSGFTELVVRSQIPFDKSKELTIYNGMPLREELRVFYNMDTKQIEYIVDYWDYDYCYPNLTCLNDKIAFNNFHNIEHNIKMLKYEQYIKDNINSLQFDSCLKGIWSIDFMAYQDELYLIDMARGFRSAYWNINKIHK